ncbi:MAG TPA: MFS transporter [Thermomicrobiales bacterium]|nr:MFS transporter [Thermomicrobiales bacterium]
MQQVRELHGRTFAALGVRNYRLYFIGQGISLSGTWMQSVAQALLVLQLTGSGTSLGLVTALQTLPVLLLGAWGGVLADRLPKRPLLLATQAAFGLLATLLGLLVATGRIQIWMVYAIAPALGLVTAVDNPVRQVFMLEMVGPAQLVNAVSLNSTEVNLARVIGPSLAGVLIATVGLGPCFLLNGASYVAVIVVLLMMDLAALHPAPLVPRARGQLMEGLRYVRSSPVIRDALLMMGIIGAFTYEFSVSLPLFAEMTFHGGASAYAAMTAAMGIGSVAGGLYTASLRGDAGQGLARAALFFGLATLLAGVMPTLPLALVALLAVGFCSICFLSLANSTLQLESEPAMRGRVMALWTVAFLGSTPIGGPLVGLVGEHLGARLALGFGGVAAIAASLLGFVAMRRLAAQPGHGA